MARRRSGQALVEYVVLLALASVVGIATVSVAGPQVSTLIGEASAALADPMALINPTPTPTQMPAPAGPSTPDPGPPGPSATPAPAPTPTPTAAPTLGPTATPTPAPTPAGHDQQGQH